LGSVVWMFEVGCVGIIVVKVDAGGVSSRVGG
jgi:hypothetical protein